MLSSVSIAIISFLTSSPGNLDSNGSSVALERRNAPIYLTDVAVAQENTWKIARPPLGIPLSASVESARLKMMRLSPGHNSPDTVTKGDRVANFAVITSPSAGSLLHHVLNRTALAAYTDYSQEVIRDSFSVLYDGGRAAYIHTPSMCSLNSGQGDGGSQISATDGGCWLIDWASVGDIATPYLFEFVLGNLAKPDYDDTAAIQAAVATGKEVYLDCHYNQPWAIYKDVLVSTTAQVIRGCGRKEDPNIRIFSPSGFTHGVFDVRTGEPGPNFRDFSVMFIQPNTAPYTTYVPAFWMRASARSSFRNVGIYAAYDGVDMRGQNGGTTFDDLQLSATHIGINIDGSQDTVRVDKLHWWPFGLDPTYFIKQRVGMPIGINTGRCDGLLISDSLFFGGLGINTFYSSGYTDPTGTYAAGPTFGTIEGAGFDTTSGINMMGGAAGSSLTISSSYFSLGTPGAVAINMVGTSVPASPNIITMSGSQVTPISLPGAGPGTVNARSGTNVGAINMDGGSNHLAVSATEFDSLGVDVSAVTQSGGVLNLSGNNFVRQPTIRYMKQTLSFTGGRTIAIGNYSVEGQKNAVFMNIKNDNPWNKIIGNSAPGWKYTATTGLSCRATPKSNIINSVRVSLCGTYAFNN